MRLPRVGPGSRSGRFKGEVAAARQERDAALKLIDERTEGLARIQQQRDAWRRYAYTGETKPTDFLDGNQVNRTETLVEELRDKLTAAVRAARAETWAKASAVAAEWDTFVAGKIDLAARGGQ